MSLPHPGEGSSSREDGVTHNRANCSKVSRYLFWSQFLFFKGYSSCSFLSSLDWWIPPHTPTQIIFFYLFIFSLLSFMPDDKVLVQALNLEIHFLGCKNDFTNTKDVSWILVLVFESELMGWFHATSNQVFILKCVGVFRLYVRNLSSSIIKVKGL